MPSAPITFDLTGDVPDAFSMDFQQSGLLLTVSSALYNGGTGADQLPYEFSTPTLSMTSDGIGALNTYDDLGAGFDSHGKYEMATLSFSQAIRITSITLIPLGTRYNLSGENTQFVMFGDGLIINPASRQTIDPTDFTNETSIYGSYLGIAAYSRNDQFRLASITVETVDLTSFADAYAVSINAGATTLAVLANDVDGRLISSIDTTGVLGSVILAADQQTLIYNVGSAFDHLGFGQQATETFTYTVLGWDGTSETQTVTITVTGGANEITGTAVADRLNGTAKRDVIYGLAGNDTIYGLGGNDEIHGGADIDRLYGGDGDDVLNGGDGNDYLYGDAGQDTLLGGAGDDRLYGGDGGDVLNGGDGNDYLYGDAGNDTLVGGAGDDRLYGGDGDDSLDGSVGADRLYGGAGNDVLTGSNLANILDGGTGADTMAGGAGNDSYFVDDIGDVVIELASGGTDTVTASVSFTLAENVENLVLTGTGALDGTGNSLANRLTGNAGDNLLVGLGGNDRVVGGLGDDILIGGTGRDNLTGGAGADEFHFAEFGSTNYDTIVDFDRAEDTIHLAGAVFGLGEGALQEANFVLGTTASNASHRIVYDQATGNLYFDADGNGSGARQLIASLADGTPLLHTDIFVF